MSTLLLVSVSSQDTRDLSKTDGEILSHKKFQLRNIQRKLWSMQISATLDFGMDKCGIFIDPTSKVSLKSALLNLKT